MLQLVLLLELVAITPIKVYKENNTSYICRRSPPLCTSNPNTKPITLAVVRNSESSLTSVVRRGKIGATYTSSVLQRSCHKKDPERISGDGT